jgi:hypothetical protein
VRSRRNSRILKIAGTFLLLGLLSLRPARAIELIELSGVAHGYPALRDLTGKTLAEGEFMQWVQDDRLHIKIVYRFKDHGRIEESGVFRQQPELVQEEWLWRETRSEQIVREFRVNFQSGIATAQKREETGLKHWEEKIDAEPGKTFAGFGFTLALQNLRKRLLNKEKIELQAVGFRPKPQMVGVELSHAGVDEMEMSGRTVKGDQFVIHPKIPAIAKVFVRVPDTHIWLAHPAPPGFLRLEGPIAEPNDPIVRVDLLPGDRSESAQPAKEESAD